ncbi:MAG: hypothetical protein PWP23_827 [Candidatus Sumerlaeota bacterium]|nr:hypothetical protein [Candidatus Sumerlaeota bacterium]
MKRRNLAVLVLALIAFSGLLAAQSGTTKNASSGTTLSLDTYSIIIERNIFNPTRRAPSSRPAPPVSRAPAVTTITLIGAVVKEDERTAIFSSAVTEHAGHRKTGDSIAGFTIESIDTKGVTISIDGDTKLWAVGSILRRIDDGDWYLPQAAGAATDITKDPAAEAAILKRMRERREQEKAK